MIHDIYFTLVDLDEQTLLAKKIIKDRDSHSEYDIDEVVNRIRSILRYILLSVEEYQRLGKGLGEVSLFVQNSQPNKET